MAKIMTVRPPDELHEIIKKEAVKYGFTMNNLILKILWDWVKANTKKGVE